VVVVIGFVCIDRFDYFLGFGPRRGHNGGMLEPRFVIGEKVIYIPGFTQDRESGAGLFEVLRTMPDENVGRSYRIRNTTDGHERVAREHQLDKLP
jgi:hypothetical protein